MNTQKPIYTERIRCQDCYKCVRQCPVKAIQVVDDSAQVVAEHCIYCGNCVSTCPVGAKKVRDDLNRVKALLKRKNRVIASLAPSFVSEFPGVEPERLIRALKELGFWAVSETALGAEEVSAACANLLKQSNSGIYYSTACPTVVEMIRKYYPEKLSQLTPITSPLLAQCVMLRRHFGEDVNIVFIGPCISKKLEADQRPDLLDLAVSFQALKRWFNTMGIEPELQIATPEDVFVPKSAKEGALYPMDGGMNRGIARYGGLDDVTFLSFSGIQNIQQAMEGLDQLSGNRKLFLELLACEGGCVNGPMASRDSGTAIKCMQVLDYVSSTEGAQVDGHLPLTQYWQAEPVNTAFHTPQEMARAMRRLGKTVPEDELNCGGCGYDSCRHLAAALLEGRAEPNMCVSYMRKMAMNKANALIRSMPAGVVIVDEHLLIVECNRRFAETLGGELPDIYDARPGMEGADMKKVGPQMLTFFAAGLEMEEGAFRKDVQVGDRLLRLTIFPVEMGRVVGGIIQDITEPAVQREQIIQRAQDVVRRNVTTVQKIAYLLGENAAETEMILESIASSFRINPSPLGGPAPEDENHG